MNNKTVEELLYEFRVGENSFLITIRCQLEWTHDRFIKLVNVMKNYCHEKREEDILDKEIAQGFWYASSFIRDWTSHPNFRKANKFSDEYYDKCYDIIFNLSYWYFMGEPIYTDEKYYDDDIKSLDVYIKNN